LWEATSAKLDVELRLEVGEVGVRLLELDHRPVHLGHRLGGGHAAGGQHGVGG
jgi:hypothetical protein